MVSQHFGPIEFLWCLESNHVNSTKATSQKCQRYVLTKIPGYSSWILDPARFCKPLRPLEVKVVRFQILKHGTKTLQILVNLTKSKSFQGGYYTYLFQHLSKYMHICIYNMCKCENNGNICIYYIYIYIENMNNSMYNTYENICNKIQMNIKYDKICIFT